MGEHVPRKKFSCDFETTTKLDDCRVWAYGYMEIGNKSNYKINNSLHEFMVWMESVKADIYFHNLRFDGEFIVNYLLSHGYEHNDSGEPMTFNTTISNMGQWYMIDIAYGYKYTKKGRQKLHTAIYDSLKKLPFSVKGVAEGFNLPIAKGDIDYHLERPVGWEITPEEHEYIKLDIEIIADALEVQFNQGLTKMTTGSDSLGGFKDIISKKQFENLFPVLSFEEDHELRKAYRGGFTWLNRAYANKWVGEGIVFDVNSLYPSQMYIRELPYGFPIKFKGEYEWDEKYPLHIQILECEFLIHDKKIPTIQIKKHFNFKGTEYLESSDGERVTLYVTNIDLELIREHYEIHEPVYLGGWKFRSKVGIFKEFIDKWTFIKNDSGTSKAKRLLAKLMLNSLYGKFASNPKVTGKIPRLRPDGSTVLELPRDDEGKIIEEYKDPVYTPMGIFITSWARYTCITTAQKCYDRIIYCDTDSIHLTGTEVPEAIADIVDPKKLGYWKHEGTFKRAKFIRQKTYLEQYDVSKDDWDYLYFKKLLKGKQVKVKMPRPDVKCAGMPERIKRFVSWNNFERGFSCHGKLLPKHVKGGVVLIDTEFTIK